MPAERVMQLMVQNLQGFAHRSSLVHLAGLILRRADRSPTGFRGTGQKPNSGCDGVFFQTKTENFSWALKTAGSQISGHKTVIHMLGTETLATALNFPKRVLTQRRDRSSWVEEQLLFRTGQGESVAGARHQVSVHNNSTGAAVFLALFIFLLLPCISSL